MHVCIYAFLVRFRVCTLLNDISRPPSTYSLENISCNFLGASSLGKESVASTAAKRDRIWIYIIPKETS